MKTKTIFKVLLRIFIISVLFLTSCTSSEVIIDEVENTTNDSNIGVDESNFNRNTVWMRLEITYHESVTEAQKQALRDYYFNAVGLIIFDITNKKDFWTIEQYRWSAYQLTNGTDVDADVENEAEVKEISLIIFN
ncbi:MAG: hypothetical protein QM478_00315 [Flavobacteriaceae bacterium]